MKAQKTILITAFEPFGTDRINPTQLIFDRLPERIGGYQIHKLLLPVEFRRAPHLAAEAYDALSPAAVLMLGQAGGRAAVTPETTAKNIMNASFPDNAGYMPAKVPVIDGAPEVLKSTLPITAIIGAIRSCGVPAEVSDDAGTYVCNCLLYSMLYHIGGAVPTGFIHVPFIPEQGHGDKPYLELDEAYRGVLAAVEAVIHSLGDAK